MAAPVPPYDPDLGAKVLQLRHAGVPFDVIAEQLSLTPEAAKAMFDKALGASDPAFMRALESGRMDRLHFAVWPRALKGELDAIDRVVKISERREVVSHVPKVNTHDLRQAFDRSAATAADSGSDIDAALVETGRKIADRVDEATATGVGAEVTKALYLIPHMMNVLREMEATPASRTAAAQRAAEEEPKDTDGRLAQLRAIRERRTSG